ncbi:hypothetical protein HN51_016196 [Arachis hypogaea]|uniref:uncharacterized protein n=1 Tax=Arachis hypogaea TaxID=3818 RepID=UPI000DEC5D8B|nr:uncharacterized protein LOC112698207 isoform X1 [Arachis hypogaea]QHO46701.1 Zinc finger protein [Arachis hypogaea]
MSNNVSSSSPANQPDKKGKEKVNFDEMNKDKQILVNEPNVPNNMNNKRKAIMLGDDHDHPNTDGSAAVTEDGSDSTKEQEPNSDKTLIIGSQNSQKKKISYNCTFCDKSFSSAQALGGHQNGHRMERMQQSHNKNSSGNDGIQLLNNMTMGAGMNSSSSTSSMELPSSPTIPSFRPFFNGEPNMMIMGYNNNIINNDYHPYHHGLFQNNGGRPSNFFSPGPVVGANNNFAYPRVGSAFDAVGVGNVGAFQHPYEFQTRVGLNDAASVNPGPGGTSQHPRPAMAAVEISRTRIGNNNNNNNGGVERQIVNEACETPQGEFEFVLLPCAARNNENNMVEIDFGLVPKKDENGEAKEKAASETD